MKETLKKFGRRAFDSVKSELIGVGIFVGLVWVVFFLDYFLPLSEWFALLPRKLAGLPGIVAMPFLHADLAHILANTFPLVVLLGLMAGSRVNTWKIVAAIILGSGGLLWIAGFSKTEYVGASMLVFGLIGFLVPAGFLEKRPVPIVISVIVAVMYGWTFFTGLIPVSRQISELAHFYGGLTGVALAFLLARAPGAKHEDAPLETVTRDII